MISRCSMTRMRTRSGRRCAPSSTCGPRPHGRHNEKRLGPPLQGGLAESVDLVERQ